MGKDTSSAKASVPPWLDARMTSLAGVTNHLANLGMIAAIAFWWLKNGPVDPPFGLVVTCWTLFSLGIVVSPLAGRLPPRWFHVPRGERTFHRMLGVGAFGRLLDWSGWNRKYAIPLRGDVSRASLPHIHLCMRASAGAHTIAFAPHLVLAALAYFTGHPWAALGILLPGVVVHLYPVLLQRSNMLRLQPLLARSQASHQPSR